MDKLLKLFSNGEVPVEGIVLECNKLGSDFCRPHDDDGVSELNARLGLGLVGGARVVADGGTPLALAKAASAA